MAATDDRDRRPARSHRGLVRAAVDPEGQARTRSWRRRRPGPSRSGPRSCGHRSSPDASRRSPRPAPGSGRPGHRYEQHVRRHGDRGETRRVGRLLDRDDADAERADARHDLVRSLHGRRDRPRRRPHGSARGLARPLPPGASPSADPRQTGRSRPRGSPGRSRSAARRAAKPTGPRPWALVRAVQASRSVAYGSAVGSIRAASGRVRAPLAGRRGRRPTPSAPARRPDPEHQDASASAARVAGERIPRRLVEMGRLHALDRPGRRSFARPAAAVPCPDRSPARPRRGRRRGPRRGDSRQAAPERTAPQPTVQAAAIERRPSPRRRDAGRDHGRPSGSRVGDDGRGGHPRHRDPQVDPVAQRPGHPPPVALDVAGRAPARPPARARRTRTDTGSSRRPAGSGPETSSSDRPGRSTTRPSSSGWRSASSTSRSNSASSSRNRTPLVRPGDLAGREVRAATDHRRVRQRVMRRPERRPPAELADRSLPGRRGHDRDRQRRRVVERRQQPGIVRARSVLPTPGGPIMSMPWPPARAISSARRASSWPRTSARSGTAGATRPGRVVGRRSPSAGRRPEIVDPRHRHERPPRPPAAHRDRQPPPGWLRRSPPRRRPAGLVDRRAATTTRRTPLPRESGDHRQDARDRPHLAAEAELADQRDRGPVRADLLRAEQDAHAPSPGRATPRSCAARPGRG